MDATLPADWKALDKDAEIADEQKTGVRGKLPEYDPSFYPQKLMNVMVAPLRMWANAKHFSQWLGPSRTS
ncbi:MAG TPA: hypothetical protein VFO10_11815 [Oligoflexus sp.]|uniref:hypothetical protein n=1 Tax=Oligoflexus sp. TaxID=1971216 RepID=UPI002D802FF4|nr:hypothetical protein [Oligoflexus sp.]HET9237934.1 hypothetical protein [Oligoflexus sp.]